MAAGTPERMGRSRGGLTTRIHALIDANGTPIAIKLKARRSSIVSIVRFPRSLKSGSAQAH
jgi:hypothetical protein